MTGYPNTIIILGAGATARIMSTTERIGSFFKYICEDWHEGTPFETDHFSTWEYFEAWTQLLGILSDDHTYREKSIDDATTNICRTFPEMDKTALKKELDSYHSLYNFACFKAIAGTHINRDKLDLFSCLNHMDFLIHNSLSFKAKQDEYSSGDIEGAMRFYQLATRYLHYCELVEKKNDKDLICKYKQFWESLTQYSWDKLIDNPPPKEDRTRRASLFLPYGVISYNWDVFLLSLLFETHKEFNDKRMTIDTPNQQVQFFNDFGHPVAGLRMEKDKFGGDPEVWYQGHQAIAARVNDPAYSSRFWQIGPYLFPHGAYAFRICPHCRRTNFVSRLIGDSGLYAFGPGILPIFQTFHGNTELETENERKAFLKGKLDAIECVDCGNITRTHHTPMTCQSIFQVSKSPFFDEAFHQGANYIRHAGHLLFLGFSLALEDSLSKTMMSNALQGEKVKTVTVINYDKNLQEQCFYDAKSAKDKPNINSETQRLIELFSEQFGKENLRFSFLGFPDVLERITIQELIEWKQTAH